MLEARVPHTLETPLGTLTFDPNADRPRMTLLRAPLVETRDRTDIDTYPEDQGASIGEAFAGEAVWTLNGRLDADTHEDLQEYAQRFRGWINSLRSQDGILKWQPSGFPALQTTVRKHDRPDTSGGRGLRKPLLASLVAADPRVYTQASDEIEITIAEAGTYGDPYDDPYAEEGDGSSETTADNVGDTPTPCIVEFHGPALTPRLLNTTTGQEIRLNMQIQSGEYVEVNTHPAQRSVLLNGSPIANRYAYFDSINGTMLRLAAGENALRLVASNTDENTKAVVSWQSAWMPA